MYPTIGRCVMMALSRMIPAVFRNGSTRSADRRCVLWQIRRPTAWLLIAWLTLGPVAPAAGPGALPPTGTDAAITPVPQPLPADPLKLALGERLFNDRRLSHDDTLACSSCHDVRTNGADGSHRITAHDGSYMPFTVLSVFNAALNFRLNWQGNFRTLAGQTRSSLENPANMATTVDEVQHKLDADPRIVRQFEAAYGRPPDPSSLLDAIATYERSLLTPDSRFDLWLRGDKTALSSEEQHGYALFQSLGCISCHQGVNIGGNLYERQGVFHRLASGPKILRVPSLRNVAVLAPYFSDGSARTLHDAVRRMARAQLDQTLTDEQIDTIVAFLKTLTGTFHGVLLRAPP
jgi:cytochrome c peroxidase